MQPAPDRLYTKVKTMSFRASVSESRNLKRTKTQRLRSFDSGFASAQDDRNRGLSTH